MRDCVPFGEGGGGGCEEEDEVLHLGPTGEWRRHGKLTSWRSWHSTCPHVSVVATYGRWVVSALGGVCGRSERETGYRL